MRMSRVLGWEAMKSSAEYLALSQRYRLAKLSTPEAALWDRLEIFEHSYFILSKTAQILTRFKATLKKTSRPPVLSHDKQYSRPSSPTTD